MDIEFGRVSIIKKLDFGENRKNNKKNKNKAVLLQPLDK